MTSLRHCNKCNEYKDSLVDFYKDRTRAGGRAALCKKCDLLKKQEYARTVRAYNRTHRKTCSRKQRRRALEILGKSCVCCGETFEEYLQIDHVENDGAEHRRSMGYTGVQATYRYILANPDTRRLQVLCANCHAYKTKYKHLCREHHIGISLVTAPVLSIPQPEVV